MGKRVQEIYKVLGEDNYDFFKWEAVGAEMLDNLITGARILCVLPITGEKCPIIIFRHKHGDAMALDFSFGEEGEVGISKLCWVVDP